MDRYTFISILSGCLSRHIRYSREEGFFNVVDKEVSFIGDSMDEDLRDMLVCMGYSNKESEAFAILYNSNPSCCIMFLGWMNISPSGYVWEKDVEFENLSISKTVWSHTCTNV